MGIECGIYGRIGHQTSSPNVARMKMLGAEVRPAIRIKPLKMTMRPLEIGLTIQLTHIYHWISSGATSIPDMVARFQQSSVKSANPN